MLEFINKCQARGVTRICLADVNEGFGIGSNKLRFVQHNYSSLAVNHFVHVSDLNNRLELVKSYCTHQILSGSKKLSPSKCLIVSSNMEYIKAFRDNGFSVMTPQEIVVRLYTKE